MLGGTYDIFAQLNTGDDYSLIGATSFTTDAGGNVSVRFPAAETSSIVTRATTSVTPLASNINSVLKKDRQGYYRPLIYNPLSSFGTPNSPVLDKIALQPPVSWPLPPENDTCSGDTSHAGRLTAYQGVSYSLTAILSDNVAGTTTYTTGGSYPYESVLQTLFKPPGETMPDGSSPLTFLRIRRYRSPLLITNLIVNWRRVVEESQAGIVGRRGGNADGKTVYATRPDSLMNTAGISHPVIIFYLQETIYKRSMSKFQGVRGSSRFCADFGGIPRDGSGRDNLHAVQGSVALSEKAGSAQARTASAEVFRPNFEDKRSRMRDNSRRSEML